MFEMKDTIYVLHERGTVSHFIALETFAKANSKTIRYREFSIFRFLAKSLVKFDYNLLIKQLINIYFLTTLLFTKNKTLVLGIAPFDWRLILLSQILKKHRVFYFTSWTRWDGAFYPKKKLGKFGFVHKRWKFFLENSIKGVFSVTQTGLSSLKANYNIKTPTAVVNHSFIPLDFHQKGDNNFSERETVKLLYVGRLIEEKGIKELLMLATVLDSTKYTLTIVGAGPLERLVESYQKKHSNINYEGFVTSREELYRIYNNHDILLLFSKKTNYWEELFGMVIIEAMSQGLIVISTDHSGPKEIIKNNVNGFLVPDDYDLVENSKEILLKTIKSFDVLKRNAKFTSKQYLPSKLSERWGAILK